MGDDFPDERWVYKQNRIGREGVERISGLVFLFSNPKLLPGPPIVWTRSHRLRGFIGNVHRASLLGHQMWKRRVENARGCEQRENNQVLWESMSGEVIITYSLLISYELILIQETEIVPFWVMELLYSVRQSRIVNVCSVAWGERILSIPGLWGADDPNSLPLRSGAPQFRFYPPLLPRPT